MRASADKPEQRHGTAAAAPAVARRTAASAPLALQRAVGNRAAGRLLARWIKHPDVEKKGVMVPDVVAEDYNRFNPPKNE